MTDDDAVPRDVHIQRFNESFYRSDPADYLLTRFQLLMLLGARKDELAGIVAEGLDFAGMSLGPVEAGEQSEPQGSDGSVEPFLTIESQHLLHHACETVLRLFIVHATGSSVPWVELSGQRSFRVFKNRIRSEFIESSPDPELIGFVCLGNRLCPAETESFDWDGAIEGISAFFRTFAGNFLEDAALYNSIKHGLGVTASDAVAMIDGRAYGFGASVEYPESDNWDDADTRSWSLTTRWIDIGQSLGLTRVAIQMIDSIWRVGRFRHLGGGSGERLFFPVSLRPAHLRGPTQPPMRRMSWKLLTEEKLPG